MRDRFNTTDKVGAMTLKKRQAGDRLTFFSDVEVIVKDKDGNVKHHSIQKNLRTNAGANFWNAQLFGLSAAGAQANYIALTADTATPLVTDTTLTGEINNAAGLGRQQGGVTHTSNATSTVISATWTYTGSIAVVIAKAGLFTASSSGTMALETLLSSTATVNSNGDQVTVNWTINF